MFFDMQMYIYSEHLFNNLYIENTKKNPSEKINITKNALFSFTSSNPSQFYF